MKRQLSQKNGQIISSRIINGKETTYEVTYGEDDLVKSYKLIDFNQAFPKVKEQ
ncbi:TPA: hypothetical protein NJW71_001402 [Acinetobacter baumannii]|nr:hypothetical protein [Acinetobacter baumannii]